jgi:hypothetical protein
MKLLWPLLVVGLLAACGVGRTPLYPPGDEPSGGTGGAGLTNPRHTGGSPGGDTNVGNAGAGGLGGNATGNSVCRGTCDVPPGPVALRPTEAELASALVGTWDICSGGHALFGGAPSDTIGVEFGPSTLTGYGTWVGTLYFLKSGSAGPVRGRGAAYEQSYQVSDDMTLSCRSSSGQSGSWFELMYSYCPQEWWLKDLSGRKGTLASF